MTYDNQPIGDPSQAEVRAARRPYNGEFGTVCPVCGVGKLVGPQAKPNSKKNITYRERKCTKCGVTVADTVIRHREILSADEMEVEASLINDALY